MLAKTMKTSTQNLSTGFDGFECFICSSVTLLLMLGSPFFHLLSHTHIHEGKRITMEKCNSIENIYISRASVDSLTSWRENSIPFCTQKSHIHTGRDIHIVYSIDDEKREAKQTKFYFEWMPHNKHTIHIL